MLAFGVERTLDSKMKPVTGSLRADFRRVDLEFAAIPSKAEIEKNLKHSSRYERARAGVLLRELERDGSLSKTYPYPVQVWELGDGVTWVALGGEVVVDYALRLKQELGADRTWVAGYSNDVMAYIPSETRSGRRGIRRGQLDDRVPTAVTLEERFGRCRRSRSP